MPACLRADPRSPRVGVRGELTLTTPNWGDEVDWSQVTFSGRPLPAGIQHDVVRIDVGSTLCWSASRGKGNRLAVLEHGRVDLVSHTDARLALAWVPCSSFLPTT